MCAQCEFNIYISNRQLLCHAKCNVHKYEPSTSAPIFPDGFAAPAANPLYPQTAAELMAGRIPISPNESRMPTSLRSVVIGVATAREIGFIVGD